MKLNHLNLCVPHVRETAEFFEKHLGFRLAETKGRDVLAVLFDESGFALVLSNFPKAQAFEYPKDFHIGLLQENKEQVQAIHDRLQAAGTNVPPPKGMHGSWGFYFTAPGGIMVEISCPVD
jgi:lactoylglutathione lyase